MQKYQVLLFIYIMVAALSPGYEAQAQNTADSSQAAFQHAPFVEKECDSCHSSDTPGSGDLVAEAPELCFECHDQYTGAFAHSPSSLGECLLCHDPHGSENEFFLSERQPELCFLCHDQLENKMTGEQMSTHAPAEESCTACHDPHSSEIGSTLLRQEMRPLCTECHSEEGIDLQVDISAVAFKHEPIEAASSCLNCHDPHATIFDNHLLAEPMELCFQCHNQEFTTADGKVLPDTEALVANSKYLHGPIKEKNCSGCHSPHGSEHFRLLLEDYPQEFYTDAFDMDDYKLCFTCHESTLLQDEETTTLTGFRDGSRNLHYLHVNREKKGRTCRSCHEVHASNHFNHIRDSVPFGKINWPLQLKYEPLYINAEGKECKTPDDSCEKVGGSCVACHDRKYYNNKL